MDNLKAYRDKRDFKKTREPHGAKSKHKTERLRFVVQRHHASHLHYDFRLELDGVLKSWAVPKGPSLNPTDKRLAVQVEDHPIDYASFEGSIPKGHYGAGQVHIFDAGYYDFLEDANTSEFSTKLEKGSIKFVLHGHVLKGEFALVRMQDGKNKNWLLIKHRDKYALDGPFDIEDFVDDKIKNISRAIETDGEHINRRRDKRDKKKLVENAGTEKQDLMKVKLIEKVPQEQGWVFEKKYDGYRIVATRNKSNIEVMSRNGINMSPLFPSLVTCLQQAVVQRFQLDGELILEDARGKSFFQSLQKGEPFKGGLTLKYIAFDLLDLDGNDLTGFPLIERRALLELFLKKNKFSMVLPAEILDGKPNELLAYAEEKGWEGVVGKLTSSSYQRGRRSGDWVKIKVRKNLEALVCGFTKPSGSRAYFGALILGYYEEGRLIYLGNCGTGFTDADLKEIYELVEKFKVNDKPFAPAIMVAKEKEVSWLDPQLVVSVSYNDWTQDRRLRHAVFKGIRTDKTRDNINFEEIRATLPPERIQEEMIIDGNLVQLSNLNKIYWPDEGYTKGQMLTYYDEFADYMLPFLHDKPISLNRFPNGIASKSFFQKDVLPKNLPSWLETSIIFSESSNRDVHYLICNNRESLLYIANLGSIEINPWLSTYQKPEMPTFAVLDLDPNGMDFLEVIRVALTVSELLRQIKVEGYVKTSGSTGLHIYFYLQEYYNYEVARNFVEWLATSVHQQHPQTTSMERNVNKRKGLIYLDFMQNRRGQTVAAPYAIRPKKGATISTPLDWEEVNAKLTIAHYDIRSVPNRLRNMIDPWQSIWNNPIDLKSVLAAL